MDLVSVTAESSDVFPRAAISSIISIAGEMILILLSRRSWRAASLSWSSLDSTVLSSLAHCLMAKPLVIAIPDLDIAVSRDGDSKC